MYRIFKLTAVALTIATVATPSLASDARALALGGSAIAHGQGAHGAFENPASMMAMKRAGEKIHFRVGMSAEVRDTGSAIDTLTDEANENLISDIETEIDQLSNTSITCDPVFGNADDVCVTGTQPLSDLSTRLLSILDLVDDESIDIQANADIGMAFTKGNLPVAVNVHISGTGSGEPTIAESDRAYIQEFETLLDNNTLTLGEAQSSTFLTVDALGIPLGVEQPEDVLTSEAQGSALLRTQLGISFASTLSVGGVIVDAGITPKFSSLKAYSSALVVSDEFDDNQPEIADRFEDSEVSESSFTFDVGGSLALTNFPVRVAAVIRNVVPESIKTTENFEFETTPQLIVGALMHKGPLSITADMALNEAKVDNFETQKIAVGVEFATSIFALRGGLSHDAARSNDTTALSLGFGLGPLHIGGRLTGAESLEAGMQLSYSFD